MALKEWAAQRAPLFRLGSGPRPRGLLLVGVPGCGKSYVSKALGRAWSLPVFRLDMARIFSGVSLGPEAMFTRALRSIEALAPTILWIDEIETTFAAGSLDAPAAARIYASFLNWLQDRPDDVFVSATANRVEMLPPELLRKGRFDQLFFVDLPQVEERKEILAIHLRRFVSSTSGFDLIFLAKATEGWSGAELEAAVKSAAGQAVVDQRPLEQEQLLRAISQAVPLSITLEEPIRRLREWAHRRAMPASR